MCANSNTLRLWVIRLSDRFMNQGPGWALQAAASGAFCRSHAENLVDVSHEIPGDYAVASGAGLQGHINKTRSIRFTK
ncbi:hypothetical protein BKA56DRAFT_565603 [Ilyonectria sp. MPI-CAGE-AT-0026]|nr:hypothetical protein BKA56DRAFT_565603 [Ilyonectria sp. MPI-CAGE-AT-0026]